MSDDTTLQTINARGERNAHRDQPAQQFNFDLPWFDTLTAAAYVPCLDRQTRQPSREAFYEWRRRHRVVIRANGTVAKRDLDRALDLARRRATARGRHPNSLANLALHGKRS